MFFWKKKRAYGASAWGGRESMCLRARARLETADSHERAANWPRPLLLGRWRHSLALVRRLQRRAGGGQSRPYLGAWHPRSSPGSFTPAGKCLLWALCCPRARRPRRSQPQVIIMPPTNVARAMAVAASLLLLAAVGDVIMPMLAAEDTAAESFAEGRHVWHNPRQSWIPNPLEGSWILDSHARFNR